MFHHVPSYLLEVDILRGYSTLFLDWPTISGLSSPWELISIDYPHCGSTRPAHTVWGCYAHDMPNMCSHRLTHLHIISHFYRCRLQQKSHIHSHSSHVLLWHIERDSLFPWLQTTTGLYHWDPNPILMLVVAYSITTIGWMMFTIPSGGWFMTLFYTRNKKK